MVGLTFQVRRWYQIAESEPGRGRVLRTHVAVSDYPHVDAALIGYESARRGRWIPAGAVASGVEAIGWTPPGVRAGCGPTEAVERLRRIGATEAADALARVLERNRGQAVR